MEITMYTKTPCGGCDTVEMLLNQKGITRINKKDILEDEEVFQEVVALGFSGVPVVVTSDNSVPAFSGVDMDAIEKIAKLYKE